MVKMPKSAPTKASLSFQHAFKSQLWWFDVIYPLTLAFFLLASLSYVVYAGQRQWRLSLEGERSLLELSLRLSGSYHIEGAKDSILVVSAVPTELQQIGAAPQKLDASTLAYAHILDILGEARVKQVFIHWDSDAHQASDPAYDDLRRVLHKYAGVMQVAFVTLADKVDRLPLAIRQEAKWLDDGPCYDVELVQTVCSYLPDYKDWMPQYLLEQYWPQGSSGEENPVWVTEMLPSLYPSYVLHLPDRRELTNMSFKDILSKPLAFTQGHVRFEQAFLGPDAGYANVDTANIDTFAAVKSVFDPELSQPDRHSKRSAVFGTPLHVFWGQLSAMFKGHAMVQLPPLWLEVVSIMIFCFALVLMTSHYGVAACLCAFMAYAIFAPLANALAIKYARVYVPLFDTFYFGLLSFICASLGQLSLSAVKRWRLEAQQQLKGREVDLKGNFLSLLSHNLNTPVAKMQGLLGLLAKQSKNPLWQHQVHEAEALVTNLELAIRAVLMTSALEEGALSPTTRTLSTLQEELTSTMSSNLRRLGIDLQHDDSPEQSEPREQLPINFDVKVFTTSVSALAALCAGPATEVPEVPLPMKLALRLSQEQGVEQEQGSPMLTLTLKGKQARLSAELLVYLEGAHREQMFTISKPAASMLQGLSGPDLIQQIFARLVRSMMRTYQARLTQLDGDETGLELTLYSQKSSL